MEGDGLAHDDVNDGQVGAELGRFECLPQIRAPVFTCCSLGRQ